MYCSTVDVAGLAQLGALTRLLLACGFGSAGSVALARLTNLVHLTVKYDWDRAVKDKHVQVLAGSLVALTYLELSSSVIDHCRGRGLTDVGALAISSLLQMAASSWTTT
jgi:hypothetical protein